MRTITKTKSKSIVRPLAIAGIGAAVLALTVNGAYAALSASASNTTAEAVSAGTMSLTLSDNGAGFTQAVSNVVPGDVVNRYVTLSNNGSINGRNLGLAVAGTGSQALITDGTSTRALKVGVKACTVAWDVATGSCAGTTSTLLNPTTVSALGAGVTLESYDFNAGQTRNLQISLTLPDQNEVTVNGVAPTETVQGASAALTYTFGIAQRVAGTTNN